MERQRILDALAELRRRTGGAVIAYAVDLIELTDLYLVDDCLRAMDPNDDLSLVFFAGGGNIDTARRFALLLREHCRKLNIYVPDRAQSAGTLVCLAADELVLGAMAGLGPIDPQISAVSRQAGGSPHRISSEDIRAFPAMAAAWLGVDESDRAAVFDALNRHIFPATLGSFFRADRHIRRVGRELIRWQWPDREAEERGRIVDALVEGFDSHGHVVTRGEARAMGLNVRYAEREEEVLMWECAPLAQPNEGLAVELNHHHRWLAGFRSLPTLCWVSLMSGYYSFFTGAWENEIDLLEIDC